MTDICKETDRLGEVDASANSCGFSLIRIGSTPEYVLRETAARSSWKSNESASLEDKDK